MDNEVKLLSNDARIINSIRQRYKFMLEHHPNKIIQTISVSHEAAGYQIKKNFHHDKKIYSYDSAVEHIDYEVTRSFINSQPQLLFLHAGAACNLGKAVVISGESGRGKSTLISKLCKLNWKYLSDEIAPLDMNTNTVSAFPRMMYIRQNTGKILSKTQLKKNSIKTICEPSDLCRQSVPIGAIILPYFNQKRSTRIELCPPSLAAMELLINCANILDHQVKAFNFLCNLIESVPTFRLPYHSPEMAINLFIEAISKPNQLWSI